jgi:hypothetical protein
MLAFSTSTLLIFLQAVLTVESQVKVNLFDIKSRPERYPTTTNASTKNYVFLSVVPTELPFPGEADPYKEAQILKKELPRNGNLDDSAHDGNLLDNVMDTDTNEVATQTGNGTVFIEIENGTVNI